MKNTMIFVTILLLSIPLISTENKDFGFTGKVHIETMAIPEGQFNAQDFEASESHKSLSSKVKLLSIGAKKSKIFNPVRPNYVLYDYYYITYDQWRVGAVLVNFDHIDHEVTLVMTVKGPTAIEITKQFTIQANTVKVITARFTPVPWSGLYVLSAAVDGDTIASNRVSTRLYIYDVF